MRQNLLTDAQLGNDSTVTLDVLSHQIVQHLAALTDHLQQAAAGVVVLLVDLQVLGELVDTGSEDGVWTSGEPVSVGWVRLASITAVFSSLADHGRFHLSNDLPKGCVTGGEAPGSCPGRTLKRSGWAG